MFFDDHPRFLDTSEVAADLNRLNLRHEAIFGQSGHLLKDASLLDIASHDGRWTYAALAQGAKHVVGVEARPELTSAAQETLGFYGADPARFELVTADVFEYLADPPEFDVVMCLGFFYHTLRYGELLQGIRATGAQHVIVDTRSIPVKQPHIRLIIDSAEKQAHAAEDKFGHGNAVITGTPSPSALERLFTVYGFEVSHKVDWLTLIEEHKGGREVSQYRTGRRLTWTFTRTD